MSNKITSLSLSWNRFGVNSGNELATVFSGLPHGVHFLDLRGNCLGGLSAAELIKAFNKLPENVASIDLRDNNFGHFRRGIYGSELKPAPFVHTIYLSEREIKKMCSEELELLKTIFPNAKYATELENNETSSNLASLTNISEKKEGSAYPKKGSALEKAGLFANTCKKDMLLHEPLEQVYGCKSFTTMEELLQQLRKLIWHFHEGRTVSKINFNYDAYADLL